MNGTTHYDVLRVTPDAPPEIIRAAYKALSQTWHPDRNPSAQAGATMQVINAAYAVLSDPSRRADYDQSLRAASTGWTGFGVNPQPTDGAAFNTATPRGKRGRAFEVDWQAVARAQHEQARRHRVFRGESRVEAAKTFGLMLGTIILLMYLASHR